MATAWAELARAVDLSEDTSSELSRTEPWDFAIRLSFQAQPACVSHVLARLAKCNLASGDLEV